MPKCKAPACRREIYFAKNGTGAPIPMVKRRDGVFQCHYEDCTNPEMFNEKYAVSSIENKIYRLQNSIDMCEKCETREVGQDICAKCKKNEKEIIKLKAQLRGPQS